MPDRARVHPSAVVRSEVELGDEVDVGPCCLIDGRVRIGRSTRLIAHPTILDDTEIGAGHVIHPNVVIGVCDPPRCRYCRYRNLGYH